MEHSSTEISTELTTAASCISYTEPVLLTFNFQIVQAIFGVSLMIAIVTVSSNCVIIMAIVRAYIFGFSFPGHGSRGVQPSRSGASVQRTRLGTDSSSIPIVLMVSMAVTDTLLGAIIMPLYTIEILYYGQWPLGNFSCKFRMYLDIILSVSSIYHVTCMALDRYLAICRPFFHQQLSVRTGVVAVALCWAAPVAITLLFHVPEESETQVISVTFPVCLNARTFKETSTKANMMGNEDYIENIVGISESFMCVQKFSPILHAITLTMNFYIPFIAIVGFYSLILVEISRFSRRRQYLKGERAKHQPVGKTVSQREIVDNELNTTPRVSNQERNFSSTDQEIKHRSDPPNPGTATCMPHGDKRRTETVETVCASAYSIIPESSVNKAHLERSKSRKATSKSLRAAKTVSLVVVCFLVCWLPFSVYILLCTITQEQGSYELMMVILWLGYLNSCLNPILYCGHVTIKAVLKDLICRNSRKL